MNLLYAHPLLSGLCMVLTLSAILQLIVLINSDGPYKKDVPDAPANPKVTSTRQIPSGIWKVVVIVLLLCAGFEAYKHWPRDQDTFVAYPDRWVAVDIPICKSWRVFPIDRDTHYKRRIGSNPPSRPLMAKDTDDTGDLHGQTYEVISCEDHPIEMYKVVIK